MRAASIIAPENRASIRVAEKIGMAQAGMVPYRNVLLTVYRAEHASNPDAQPPVHNS
jgi:RimJ/RimL family protein N-acetyltransferase